MRGFRVINGKGQTDLRFVEEKISARCGLGGILQSGHDWKRQVVALVPGAEVQDLGIGGSVASPYRPTETFQDRGDQILVAAHQVSQSIRGGVALNPDELVVIHPR